MSDFINFNESESLVYIGENSKKLIYGKVYSVYKYKFKDGFKLVTYKSYKLWVNPKNFISINEFKDIKRDILLNKLLDE